MKENVLERNKRLHVEEKIAYFRAKQQLPYEAKVRYAAHRVREFESECARRELNTHVSVGGLDSITLLMFLRHIGVDVPAVSVSSYYKRVVFIDRSPTVCYTERDAVDWFVLPRIIKE